MDVFTIYRVELATADGARVAYEVPARTLREAVAVAYAEAAEDEVVLGDGEPIISVP